MSMVYLDSSVVLAHLRGEDVTPPAELWGESLVSSRLLTYETLSRLNSLSSGQHDQELARELLGRVATVELVEPVVGRVVDPLPVPVRTLDALHLATMAFLREQGLEVRLASYDRRLGSAAKALGFDAYPLE